MEYRLVLINEDGKETTSWLMHLDEKKKVKFIPSRNDIKKAILEQHKETQKGRGLLRVSYNG